MARDHVLQQHVGASPAVRHFHQAGQHAGHRDHPVAQPRSRRRRGEPHRQVERLVAQVGEGVAGVERDGGEDGKDLAGEVLGEEMIGLRRKLRRREQAHPRPVQVREHVAEQRPVLARHHVVAAGRDGGELLAGAHRVGAALLHVSDQLLLEAGDADHEELVEVGAGDGEELQPLERGNAGIEAFLQHALVERQPGQLAIDEKLRIVEVLDGRRSGRLRRRHHGERRRRRGGGRRHERRRPCYIPIHRLGLYSWGTTLTIRRGALHTGCIR